MKAAVVTRFGRNWSIEVREVAKPEPTANEVRVRVHAATVSRTDCGELRHPWIEKLIIRRKSGQRTILGMDFAGVIESVGDGVSLFRPGDRVFGMCPRARDGTQAEYFCMPEDSVIAPMPKGKAFDEVTVFEGAYYASASIGKFCRPGCKTLVYGASGAIGSAAVQLAKIAGADVTAVVPGRHLELARSLGADRVVDYETTEFRQLGRDFDFVLDAVGKMAVRQWRRLVKPDGHFAVTDLGPWGQDLPFLLWSALSGSSKVSVPLPKRETARAFVEFLKERIEAGEFRAVVDRKYSLDAISDAYRYVQTGQKVGSVVIECASAE